MNILSISHKIAPVGVRQKFALSEEKQKDFIVNVIGNKHIDECVYLSTCNRTEIYYNGDDLATDELEKIILKFTESTKDDLKRYFMYYQNKNAINHLYKVASGLDSMVIGEDEILGQLKNAFNFALELGATQYHINTLFKGAITCAKDIKTNTNMSKIPLSIASLVSNKILDLEKELGSVNVLILGLTGQMGKTIFKNLHFNKNIKITGATRQHNAILQYKSVDDELKMIEYKDRYDYINNSDVIVSATKSPHYTLLVNEVKESIVDNKQRVFIDLAVPKDIDDEIRELENTNLYNIDFFESIAKENNDSRVREIEYVNVIINEYIDKIIKDLEFHEFLKDIDKIKEVVSSKTFESIIYNIRDNATSEELSIILGSLKKLI